MAVDAPQIREVPSVEQPAEASAPDTRLDPHHSAREAAAVGNPGGDELEDLPASQHEATDSASEEASAAAAVESEEELTKSEEPAVAKAAGAVATDRTVERDAEQPGTKPPTDKAAAPEEPERTDPRPAAEADVKEEAPTPTETPPEASRAAADRATAENTEDEAASEPVEPVKEVAGVVVTNKEHAAAMANDGMGATATDRRTASRGGEQDTDRSEGRRTGSDRDTEVPRSDSDDTNGPRYTAEDNQHVREEVRMSGILGDTDDDGAYDLVLTEAVNEVMLLANEENRHVGALALRDLGVDIFTQPLTLRDAIKGLALEILTREVPFFEPKEKELDESAKVHTEQGPEDKKGARQQEKDEEKEKKPKDNAQEAAKADAETDDKGPERQQADDADEPVDDTSTDEVFDDEGDGPPDDGHEGPTGGDDEGEEVVDGEFVLELEKSTLDDWADEIYEKYKDEQAARAAAEADATQGRPMEPVPIGKDELSYLKHQARLFGVTQKEIRSMGPHMLKERVIDIVNARIEMGGFHPSFGDALLLKAIRGALTLGLEPDKRLLAEAIFVATHIASDRLVYAAPLHNNHHPSRAKVNAEPRLTTAENYALLRSHLQSPNPHVRREARLALARRAEWTGTPQHVRHGMPRPVYWGRDPRNTPMNRVARRIRKELFGAPKPRQRGVAYDRFAARWVRPVVNRVRRD